MEININTIYNLLIKILQNESLVHNHNVQQQFKSQNITNSSMYFGIDITSDKIHIGHIATIYICKIIQIITGLKLIIVIGTFTSEIGDPSFRSQRRSQAYIEQIHKNKEHISKIIIQICNNLDMDFQLKENHKWLNKVTLNELISHLKNFKVDDLINSRIFAKTDRKNLLLNEIMYPIIQGIDFYHLNNNHNCILQIGGQDQWINMLYGHDMIKKLNKQNTYLITLPLLTDKSGNKISKSNHNSPLFINEKSKIIEIIVSFIKINKYTKTQLCNIYHNINNKVCNEEIFNMEFIKSIFAINVKHTNKIIKFLEKHQYKEIVDIMENQIESDNYINWLDIYSEINSKTIVRSIYKDSTSKIIEIAIQSGNLLVNDKKIQKLSDIKQFTKPNKINYINNAKDVYYYYFKTNAI